MSEKLSKEQMDQILLILDKALDEAPWAATTFLTLIGKKLKKIRDEFAITIDNFGDETDGNAAILNKMHADRHALMKKIYIALYAFDGSNLQSWERIIEHLPSQVTSRAVYASEDDVVDSIRSKSNRINEAYAIMYVDPGFILNLPTEKVSVDKLGKPLLALKDKALQLNNLDVFVHQSGTYKYIKGHLVKR